MTRGSGCYVDSEDLDQPVHLCSQVGSSMSAY